ncbi:olfactory receptor 12D1-like [Gastrophryne carolinensis]
MTSRIDLWLDLNPSIVSPAIIKDRLSVYDPGLPDIAKSGSPVFTPSQVYFLFYSTKEKDGVLSINNNASKTRLIQEYKYIHLYLEISNVNSRVETSNYNSYIHLLTCIISNTAMDFKNQTIVKEFILFGLTDIVALQKALFGMCLLFYIICLVGNLSIMVVIMKDPTLHSPMYFFLWNLAFLDIVYCSVVVPKMLADFLILKKTISFVGCLIQIYFFHFFGSSEILLVTAMAYDRYIAIGKPLRYVSIMNPRVCLKLVVGSLTTGCCHSLMHTLMTAKLNFCGPKLINSFFCDVKPLLKLACEDTSVNLFLVNKVTGSLTVITTLLTLLSYVFISKFIFKIRTLEAKKRAFSTCSAHLTVGFLLHGTALFIFMRSDQALDQDRVVAVLYTVVTPALNPMIYTLRNKDMQTAIKKMVKTLVSRVE